MFQASATFLILFIYSVDIMDMLELEYMDDMRRTSQLICRLK